MDEEPITQTINPVQKTIKLITIRRTTSENEITSRPIRIIKIESTPSIPSPIQQESQLLHSPDSGLIKAGNFDTGPNTRSSHRNGKDNLVCSLPSQKEEPIWISSMTSQKEVPSKVASMAYQKEVASKVALNAEKGMICITEKEVESAELEVETEATAIEENIESPRLAKSTMELLEEEVISEVGPSAVNQKETRRQFRKPNKKQEGSLLHNICPKCGKTFSRSDSLKKHLTTTHAKEKPYKCKICFKSYRDIKEHMRIHNGQKPYLCYVCGEKFAFRASCSHHMLSHENKSDLLLKCEHCNKTFARQSVLEKHQLSHTNVKRHNCKVCENQWFKNYSSLDRHMKVYHGINAPTCDFCNKRFGAQSELQRHLISCPLQKKVFVCDSCNKIYKSKKCFKTHQQFCFVAKLSDSKDNVFTCQSCNKQFSCQSELKRHLISCLLRKKTFVCDTCPKVYTSKKCFEMHQSHCVAKRTDVKDKVAPLDYNIIRIVKVSY